MTTLLQGGTIEQFVKKLRGLRKQATGIFPDLDVPDEERPYDPIGEEYNEMRVREEIGRLYQRTRIVFERFGVTSAAEAVREIYDQNKDDLLSTIDDPPWYADEYYAIRALVNLIESYLSAYADEDEVLESSSLNYRRLHDLLQNVENTFTVMNRHPQNEDEFQRIVESVLICTFPVLNHKPAIQTPIKNFIPDTGIPAARTLIEYKFISKKEQVAGMVDEILADISGYRHPDWDNIIYVFYETERFLPEDMWREQLREFKHTSAIVIKGIPSQGERSKPQNRRSQSAGAAIIPTAPPILEAIEQPSDFTRNDQQ